MYSTLVNECLAKLMSKVFMVSLMIVITLSNPTFSSWPPSEASCTFFGCCVVLEFSKVLLGSLWVVASALLLFCFCCLNSSISAFNTAISLDWFCWFFLNAFLAGDLDLLLECLKVKDWNFCGSGLSPVGCVFWLILSHAILYYLLSCLHIPASGCLVLLWAVMFFHFSRC